MTGTNPSQPAGDRLALLYRLSQTFSASLDLDEVLNRVMDEVIAATRAERGFVMLHDAGGKPVFRVARGMDQATIDHPQFQVSRSVVDRVAREGQPVLTGDAQVDGRFSARDSIVSLGLRSILCAPLKVKDRILGVVYVDNRLQAGLFGEEDLELLVAIASSAAIAIENARLYDEARQRAAEVETLQRTSLKLTSSLDLSSVLDTIAQNALALSGATDCLIYLYDEESERFAFGTALGTWASRGTVEPPRPDGLTATVVRKGHPVVIDDAVGHPLYASPEAQGWNIQAIASFPLQRAGRVLGVLHVVSLEPHTFGVAELRVLGLLADQASIAVENARLFEAERAQLAELAVLHAVATAGAEATHEDALIERVTRIIGDTLYPADVFGVMLLDQEADALHVHASYQVAKGKEHLWQSALGRLLSDNGGRITIPVGQGITGTVAARGQPRRIGDVTHEPGYINGGIGTRSELCVPLKVGERVLGVINAESTQPDAFSEADERLLATVAGQLATAIEKLRLYEAARQEIAERRRTEGELRRLQAFNEGIIQNMSESIVVEDAEGYVTFVNPAMADLLGYEIEELLGQHWTAVIPPDQVHITEAANQRRALGQSDRYEHQAIRKDGTRVPIQVSGSPRLDPDTGRFAGTLAVFTDLTERVRAEEELRKHRDHLSELVELRTAALTEANAQLEQEIGERVQAEAERERLLVAERAQARRQAALFRLSAELAATLDEAEVCRSVVDGLRDTLGYDFLAMFLLDEATGDRVLIASAGPIEPPARMPPGQGLSEHPLLDGQLLYTPDVRHDPRYIHWLGGSEVDVPVRIGGEVLGVMIVESSQPHAFGEHDFEVLTAAAQQAGLAIEKARLLTEERQRADELEALRTTMADITAELELQTLLQAIVERAAGLLDATGGELGLYDEASQEVRIVVSHNLAEDHVGARHALGDGAMGRVAETGEPLFIEDYRTWTGRAAQYTGEPIGAVLVAPLEAGGRLAGVISSVTTDPARQFTPADLHLLSLFAQQAAIAIENARLFGEAERRVTELATLTDAGQALSSTLRVDEVVQLIFEQTGRVMYAENMIINLYDQERQEVECAFSNNPDDLAPGARFPADLGLTGYIIKHRKPVLLEDTHAESLRDLAITGAGVPSASWLGVPMLMGERALGVIIVQHYTTHGLYDESHQAVLETIASQAAIAIENARLYDQAQREIAERVRAEAELRRYQEHLEELVEERTADLRASEERYRSLFNGVPVGLYRTTPAGQTLDANPAMMQMMGYPDRETLLAAHAANSYMDPEDRARWQALMERQGLVRDFEAQHQRRDGTVIWTRETARAVKDEQGQVVHYEGSMEDITERRQAEDELRRYQEHLEELVEERTAELRQSEERYRTLFDGVPVGLYRTTSTGQLLDANLAAVQMLGHPSRETLLTVHTGSLFVNRLEAARTILLADREGVVRDLETRLYRHDGTVIWISFTARAVRDEQGQVQWYEGSLQDITERKGFEEEIRRQKEYYEALFVGSPVAVLTCDMEANVVTWNPMAESLFGYSQEEAIGRNVDDLVAKDAEFQDEAMAYTQQAYSEGRVHATAKRTRKDGSLVDVELSSLPVVVAGERVGFIALYHDISELQEARRAAEAANQAKSTFLANMSHELRTPLNAIIGFTRLVKRRSGDRLPQKQVDNLDKVLISADHLLELINAILDLSKIEAGRVDVLPTTFDLQALVGVCLQTVRPLVSSDRVSLVEEMEPDLPQLCTDQDKVRQILINLLSNAAKFTQEGAITVRAQRQGEAVALVVADTGIGIPEEALERIFDPFQQVDTSTTRRYGGTGLGLSICRHLAQLLGGQVSVESAVGEGSTFTVTIPIRYGAAPPPPASAPRLEALAPATAAQPGEGPVVLAIDDDPNVLYLLQEDLGEAGYRVVGVADPEEGLQKARALKPFAIILDILMSPKDGWQVLHELKADVATRDIPVVVLSIVDNQDLGYRLGAFDYLVKPFDRETILAALNRITPAQEDLPEVDLLVVDDDPHVVDLVCQLLEGEPYRVRSAADGREALDAISRQPPDVILLDLVMPWLDGFGVIGRLQQTPQTRDIPIVVLTAKTLTPDELAQLQQRVTKVVQKRALVRKDLIQDLRQALRAYRQNVEDPNT